MGGIPTGGDGEGYSVPGMAGAEQEQEHPQRCADHWEGDGTRGTRRGGQSVMLSAFKLQRPDFSLQLNIKENDLYL